MTHEVMNEENLIDLRSAVPRVTPCMVRARTVEMAINAGRNALEIRQLDYELAKRELTGETDSARQFAVLYPMS